MGLPTDRCCRASGPAYRVWMFEPFCLLAMHCYAFFLLGVCLDSLYFGTTGSPLALRMLKMKTISVCGLATRLRRDALGFAISPIIDFGDNLVRDGKIALYAGRYPCLQISCICDICCSEIFGEKRPGLGQRNVSSCCAYQIYLSGV